MVKITNTVLSLSFDIRISELDKVKKFMGEKYKSVYMDPGHLTVLICPVSEKKYVEMHKELVKYINTLKKIPIQFNELFFDPDRNFFGINIVSHELVKIESNLLKIGNTYRESAIRKKDFDRISKGVFTNKELIKNIYDNGFIYSGKYFHPHISVGNITNGEFNVEVVKDEILNILKPIMNIDYTFDVMRLNFQLDAEKWADMHDIAEELYFLK